MVELESWGEEWSGEEEYSGVVRRSGEQRGGVNILVGVTGKG